MMQKIGIGIKAIRVLRPQSHSEISETAAMSLWFMPILFPPSMLVPSLKLAKLWNCRDPLQVLSHGGS